MQRAWFGRALPFLLVATGLSVAARFYVAAGPIAPRAGPADGGLVVESVVPEGAADRAGVAVGDLLFAFAVDDAAGAGSAGAGPTGGPLSSPLALTAVEQAYGAAASVVLIGERNGERLSWKLGARDWGIEAGLRSAAMDRETRREAMRAIETGAADRGAATLLELADRRPAEAAWLLADGARHLAAASAWAASDQLHDEALRRVATTDQGTLPTAELHAAGLRAVIERSRAATLRHFSRYPEAVRAGRRAIAEWQRAGGAELAVAAARLDLVETLLLLGNLDGVVRELEAARAELSGRAPRSELFAHLLSRQGKVELERGLPDPAEEYLREALSLFETVAPGGLRAATALDDFGILLRRRGDLDGAETHHRRALEIEQRLDPQGLSVAQTFNGLGLVAYSRGDLELARRHHLDALEIRERLAPGSLDLTKSLVNLAGIDERRGDLAAAQRRFEQALEIRERLAPGSMILANSYTNLGVICHARGDLAAAEAAYRRALEIEERLAPGSIQSAHTMSNLGSLLLDRRDLDSAEAFVSRALQIHERHTPDGPFVPAALINLASLKEKRGELAAASELVERVIVLRQKLGPESLQAALALRNAGQLALARGDVEAAQRSFESALAIEQKVAPGGDGMARTHAALADLALAGADLGAARGHQLRALAIRQRLRPGTFHEAESLQALGRLAQQSGDLEAAVDWLERAVVAVERQMERLGGRQLVRAEFAAHHLPAYHRLTELLIALGRPAEAFEVVERSRARTLLALLAERDLDLGGELPADLRKRRRDNEREYDQHQALTGRLHPVRDRDQLERVLARQRELQDEAAVLREEIRRRVPHLAALRYPVALDLAATRASLEAGSVLLSYLVSDKAAWLFVVRDPTAAGEGLAVHRLTATGVELERRVSVLRSLIERGARTGLTENSENAYLEQARRLHQQLVDPAGPALSAAKRIVISPDGPLHALPFGALVTGSEERGDRYLVEVAPIHKVLSATLHAQLGIPGKEGTAPRPRIAAFGDPALPAPPAGTAETVWNAELRSMLSTERGFALGALPHSRSEVETLGRLYAPMAQVFVGEDATEEAAKVVGPRADILHFAVHSILDADSPMNSALVLSRRSDGAPGRDNGLLQAWEIFERLRLDADLVTLSACQTALGREVSGEGLLGLARAFQFAGARSVIASLWSVSDRSTTELMTRFYSELLTGADKDEALRAAQLHLIRGGAGAGAATPFHWAAFELYGHWE